MGHTIYVLEMITGLGKTCCVHTCIYHNKVLTKTMLIILPGCPLKPLHVSICESDFWRAVKWYLWRTTNLVSIVNWIYSIQERPTLFLILHFFKCTCTHMIHRSYFFTEQHFESRYIEKDQHNHGGQIGWSILLNLPPLYAAFSMFNA